MPCSILIGWTLNTEYASICIFANALVFSYWLRFGWLCYWWWWCDGSLSIRMNIVQVFFVVFSVSVPSFYRILLFFDTTQITTQRVHFLNKNKWSVSISYVCMVCVCVSVLACTFPGCYCWIVMVALLILLLVSLLLVMVVAVVYSIIETMKVYSNMMLSPYCIKFPPNRTHCDKMRQSIFSIYFSIHSIFY